MSIIAKFKVTSITMQEGTRRKRDAAGDWVKTKSGGFELEPCMSGEVKMAPVYANDDARHENSKFWDASPAGEFRMWVNNLEALKSLEVGKAYYIRIDPAGAAAE